MDRVVTAFDHSELGDDLDDDVQRLIGDAIDAIDDLLIQEITDRFADPVDGIRFFSDLYLPDRHRDLYSVPVVRRLHICFIQVVDRLAQPTWSGLSCRGEELALRAVVEQVRADAQMTNPTGERDAKVESVMSWLCDTAFDDGDIELAFDLAFDGIDDPETAEGRQFGVLPLHPSRWFEPMGELPVHPLAARQF